MPDEDLSGISRGLFGIVGPDVRNRQSALRDDSVLMIVPAPTTYATFPSPHLVESWAVNYTLQSHGSLPRKAPNVLYQARISPRWETAPNHRSSSIQASRISRTPDQPQYELSHHFFRSNANLTPSFSFSTPRRAYPLHSLSHLPEPVGRWSLCMVPCRVSNGHQ